jgi:hypothetical protein
MPSKHKPAQQCRVDAVKTTPTMSGGALQPSTGAVLLQKPICLVSGSITTTTTRTITKMKYCCAKSSALQFFVHLC